MVVIASPAAALVVRAADVDGLLSEAGPARDSQGALWQIRLEATHHWGLFEGRPAPLALGDLHLFTPWGRWLVERPIATGDIEPLALQMSSRIAEVAAVEERHVVACTIEESADIIVAVGNPPVMKTLHGHSREPWRIVLSPDGRRLVSCADDKSVRLWDTERGSEIARIPGYGEGLSPAGEGRPGFRGEIAAFSPDGKWLATTVGENIYLRRSTDGAQIVSTKTVFPQFAAGVLRFAPDNHQLFAFRLAEGWKGDAPRFVGWRIDQPNQLKPELVTYIGTHPVYDGIFTADGRHAITWTFRSGEVVIWNLQGRKETAVIHAAPENIGAVALSPDERLLATAGDDDKISFWNTADWKRASIQDSYSLNVCFFLHFSADGKYLVGANSNGVVKVWQAPNGTAAQ